MKIAVRMTSLQEKTKERENSAVGYVRAWKDDDAIDGGLMTKEQIAGNMRSWGFPEEGEIDPEDIVQEAIDKKLIIKSGIKTLEWGEDTYIVNPEMEQ